MFWYYLAIGVIAGVMIVLPMYLPLAWTGPIAVGGALLIWLIDRLFFGGARPSRSGSRRDQLPYMLCLAALFIGSMALSWTVLRANGMYWIGWILAAMTAALIVFLGPVIQKRARPSLQN